jgi:hypothetical protein
MEDTSQLDTDITSSDNCNTFWLVLKIEETVGIDT